MIRPDLMHFGLSKVKPLCAPMLRGVSLAEARSTRFASQGLRGTLCSARGRDDDRYAYKEFDLAHVSVLTTSDHPLLNQRVYSHLRV